ncbi:hypothetical protein AB0B79_06800 [Streptomyces sp. NPDC039022]|uniref:hypothetical protein n=1 Tax=Streptomyces sp. NPDC039022 TaxID=3157091 RepID=UPI00340BF0F0
MALLAARRREAPPLTLAVGVKWPVVPPLLLAAAGAARPPPLTRESSPASPLWVRRSRRDLTHGGAPAEAEDQQRNGGGDARGLR